MKNSMKTDYHMIFIEYFFINGYFSTKYLLGNYCSGLIKQEIFNREYNTLFSKNRKSDCGQFEKKGLKT